MENRPTDVRPTGQPGAAATQSTVLLSATLLQMGTVVQQLRCGQPVRRSALRVMLFLDRLACCDAFEPGLRRDFAELAEAWTDVLDKSYAGAHRRSPTQRGTASGDGARARGPLRLVIGHRSAA